MAFRGTAPDSWLLKKGQRSVLADSWKKRYFSFDTRARTLRYYKDAPDPDAAAGDADPLGEVIVAGVDARGDLQGVRGHKPHRFDFTLHDETGQRSVLAVSAANAGTRRRWIEACAGTIRPLA